MRAKETSPKQQIFHFGQGQVNPGFNLRSVDKEGDGTPENYAISVKP